MSYAPFTYKTEQGKPAGLEVELITAVAEEMGLKPEFTEISFTSLIPAVSNGRVDVAINQITDTAERQKSVQFVDYARLTYQVMVNPNVKGASVDNLCGLTFALTNGSTQLPIVEELSKECVAAGKKAIGHNLYPDTGTTIVAVSNGQSDAFLTNPATGYYYSQQPDKHLIPIPGEVPGYELIAGIALDKTDNELAQALMTALTRMKADGTYQKILEAYGAPNNAVDKFTINAGS